MKLKELTMSAGIKDFLDDYFGCMWNDLVTANGEECLDNNGDEATLTIVGGEITDIEATVGLVATAPIIFEESSYEFGDIDFD